MTPSTPVTKVGFLGVGTMGTPMALNLAKHFPLAVWNRTASEEKYAPLRQAGASIEDTPARVAEQADVVFMMLYNDDAVRSVLEDDDFKKALHGTTLINCGSVSFDFNRHLDQYTREAGGSFVEMPVSGSKIPAEQGKLVGMMAGDPDVADRIRPFVEPLTTAAIYCGPLGAGLKSKFAVNLYVTAMAAGLAESMNLARAQGLDLETFGQLLNAGPMASAYSSSKITKIIAGDWTTQASVRDCHKGAELICSAADAAGAPAPLARLLTSLYGEAKENGIVEEDMIALYQMFEKQSQQQP